MKRKRMRTEDAALQVIAEQGRVHVWYGDPDLIAEIAERAGHDPETHPINRSAAVVGALAKSRKFRRAGFIEHLGHKYPLYTPIKPDEA